MVGGSLAVRYWRLGGGIVVIESLRGNVATLTRETLTLSVSAFTVLSPLVVPKGNKRWYLLAMLPAAHSDAL